MSSDNYQFAKSNAPQGLEHETPYMDEQWNFVNDINSGVYSSGPSLVQFDLSSIFNSDRLCDVNRAYTVIPVVYCAAYTAGSTNTALGLAANVSYFQQCGLKFNYANLINQIEISVNGKVLDQMQPFTNVYSNMRMISSMSIDDLQSYGITWGMGRCLDNVESLRYNGPGVLSSLVTGGTYPSSTGTWLQAGASSGGVGGNGLSNCSIYGLNSNDGDQTSVGFQNGSSYNIGAYYRLNRLNDYSAQTYAVGASPCTNLYGPNTVNGTNLQTITQANTEFRPTFQVINNVMVWTDYCVIPLANILDSIRQFPLTKRFDATVRMYLNTNSMVNCQVATGAAGATNAQSLLSSGSYNTFQNTCPLMINSVYSATATTIPATATVLTAGLFVGRVTSISLNGINFATIGAAIPSSSMPACRIYYPLVQLKPNLRSLYINENRNKKVVYTSFLYNQFNAISSGSTFSQLVQSGLQNIRGVWILPVISSSVNGLTGAGFTVANGITAFSTFSSPFTDGLYNGPLSLTNLNVTVAGINKVQNSYITDFENWIQQISRYEKPVGASDVGMSVGLLGQYQFENGIRAYYIDCSRDSPASQMSPRNVNITFQNNSAVTIDVLIFCEVFKEVVVDVENGLIR